MKTQLPPCRVSPLPFPTTLYNYALKNPLNPDEKHTTFGNFSHDGMWVWLIKGSSLEVFSTHTIERCSSWSLSVPTKDFVTSISAVVEFRAVVNPVLRLLIAVDWGRSNSLLCLYDVKMSKILKAIEFSSKITSLDVISSHAGTCSETYALSKELCYMFGIVAVGMSNGQVLIVDLNLDDDNYCNENDPNTITFITQQTHNIMGKRENAQAHNQHLCLPLNGDRHHGYFQYRDHDNSPLQTFNSDDAAVTVLKFFRHVNLLAVGFQFGGVQLWSMSHLNLHYSCPLEDYMLPVIKFAFQEPENDPKNFCYFWAIRGTEEDHPEVQTIASLYSLSYSKKELIDNYGFLYQGFQNCCLRFEYALGTDPLQSNENDEVISRLISCYTIQQSDILSIGRPEHEDTLHNEDWNTSPDYSLCVLAWEASDESTENSPVSYLVLFDMNQWYRTQMPHTVRCSSTKFCSYLGIFSLSQISEQSSTLPLLNLQIKTNTLAKFKSLSTADEFYFPASLSFKLFSLMESGIIEAEYLGCQRMVLSEMINAGPMCILEPKTLFSFCEFTGLIQQKQGNALSKTLMREALLSVALENNLSYFINSCIQMWSKGEFASSGCTLKFIFDWLWKRVSQIKTSIDKLCVPLFNYSGQELDHSTLRLLHHYVSKLQTLASIFQLLQNQAVPIREQGEQELEQRRDVTQLIAVYLKVILWLYNCSLLPEYIEGEAYGENEVAYPVSVLSEAYSSRREELQKLHSTIGQTDILIIDGMISEMGAALSNQWEKAGWNGVYPPPSFYAVLNTYLINTISIMDKHQLMLYVLLDMASFLSDRQSHLVEKFMKFPAVFCLNPSHVKIVHSFWLLDHQDFEEAISVLLDPMINSLDILPWQHVRILKAFLYQGEHKKAMKYYQIRNPPHQTPEEVKLYLTIYLANGLTAQAFHFQRKFHNQGNAEDLLNHFFLGCQQTGNLDALFQLHLRPLEEDALISFLHNSSDPKAQELLIMFFLQRSRPIEAAYLNEKLNSQFSTQDYQKAAARNALVNGYMQILPKIQMQLVKEIGSQSSSKFTIQRQTIPKPQPLSSTIKVKTLEAVSRSDLHLAVINKVKEIQETSMESENSFNKSSKGNKFWKTDSIPFIGTPLSRNEKSTNEMKHVVYATPIIRHLNNEKEYSVSPKSRLYDSFRHSESDKKRNYRILSGEVSSLLQTPPIRKKTPVGRSKILDQRNSLMNVTPHSILKVRSEGSKVENMYLESTRLSQGNLNDVFEKSDYKDDDSTNPSESIDITEQEDSNVKQLRFKVPEVRSPLGGITGKWLTPNKSILKSFYEKNLLKENYNITKCRSVECSARPSLHDNVTTQTVGQDVYLSPSIVSEKMELGEEENVPDKDAPVLKEKNFPVPEIEMREESRATSESSDKTEQMPQIEYYGDDLKKEVKQKLFDKKESETEPSLVLSDSESEYEECLKDELTEERLRIESEDFGIEKSRDKEMESESINLYSKNEDLSLSHISPMKSSINLHLTPESTPEKHSLQVPGEKSLTSSPFEGTRSRSRSKSKSPSSSHLKETPPSQLKSSTLFKMTTRSKTKELPESTKQTVKTPRKSKKSGDESSETKVLPQLSTPQTSVPSFVFSPPVTRSRSRQKKTDDSFLSNTSILTAEPQSRQKKSVKEEPTDIFMTPIREKEVASVKESASHIKKNTGKKKRISKLSITPASTSVISLATPVSSSVSATPSHRSSVTGRHSMKLRKERQAKTRKFTNLSHQDSFTVNSYLLLLCIYQNVNHILQNYNLLS
ncbi:protein ELYS-like isoform X4 [Centruroides sculpturatus]|uniref:protein ELYS-like isoform X4 n=1 Tax=Centruroides sculpturatus TaxID=218467 RepID=UPI000C6D7AE0|nr:protein ELYS-like isoform X4 [Centruroides sculpturatus]